jgi:NodT family efflux transporter outer membrane factor (OMF) lipoprotein
MKYYVLVFCLFVLQSCTVGPDFVRPDPPAAKKYTKADDVTEFGEQKIQADKKIAVDWWNEFNNPRLNAVVERGVQNNLRLLAFKKDVDEAEELLSAEQGKLWPFLSFNAGAGRQKYGAAFLGPLDPSIPAFTYYQMGPSLTYLIDVFGLTRRAIENQQALTEYAHHVYDAAYLSFTGKIIETAISIAVLNDQIDTTLTLIKQDEKNLKLMKDSLKLGSATQNDVIIATNQLTTDSALLPQLNLQLTLRKNELSSLVGSTPTEWEVPDFKLAQFKLPHTLPLTIPSELVRTRPDILAAEAVVHAANAYVGVATASLYPQISLSGSYLQEALTPGSLFKASSGAWNYLGNVGAPLFSGGALQANKRAAILAYESSFANYQDVVVKAFIQVNDTLHSLKYNEESNQLGKLTLATAEQYYQLAQKSHQVGATGLGEQLQAERKYLEAKLSYTQIESQRYLDTLKLYLVMGGRSY